MEVPVKVAVAVAAALSQELKNWLCFSAVRSLKLRCLESFSKSSFVPCDVASWQRFEVVAASAAVSASA